MATKMPSIEFWLPWQNARRPHSVPHSIRRHPEHWGLNNVILGFRQLRSFKTWRFCHYTSVVFSWLGGFLSRLLFLKFTLQASIFLFFFFFCELQGSMQKSQCRYILALTGLRSFCTWDGESKKKKEKTHTEIFATQQRCMGELLVVLGGEKSDYS